jgi:hypothetical protein
MRFQKPCLAAAVLVMAVTGLVSAGPALAGDGATPPAEGTDPTAGTPATVAEPGERKVEYGVGIRIRNVRAPQALLELFVDRTPGGVSNVGFGVDLTRRRGNVELQLGFEFEHIQPTEGVWIESNSDVAAGDEADYIVSPEHNSDKSLGWFTIEFTFLNHAEINKHVAIRYGGGAGIGIVTGELARYNMFCNGATNSSPEPGCVPPVSPFNGSGTLSADGNMMLQKYNLPPVFPVVNAIIGVQIRPVPKAAINIEGGIRTFPFFGISGGYFF